MRSGGRGPRQAASAWGGSPAGAGGGCALRERPVRSVPQPQHALSARRRRRCHLPGIPVHAAFSRRSYIAAACRIPQAGEERPACRPSPGRLCTTPCPHARRGRGGPQRHVACGAVTCDLRRASQPPRGTRCDAGSAPGIEAPATPPGGSESLSERASRIRRF